MKTTILTVVAHPDDEILGCGGTVARLVDEGAAAYTLILGEGVTSRDTHRVAKIRRKQLDSLKKQARKANAIIGVKQVFFQELPDNRFDSVPLLDVVKAVECVIERVKPSIVFTHFERDLNIDHEVTFRAVLTATRPLPGQSVRTVYACEILSSTEYRYPSMFSPNVFFDIGTTISRKSRALGLYTGELRIFPHPRSLKGIDFAAHCWGMKIGVTYAEAFELVRDMR